MNKDCIEYNIPILGGMFLCIILLIILIYRHLLFCYDRFNPLNNYFSYNIMNYKNSGVDVEKVICLLISLKICKNGKIGGFSGIYEYNNLKLVASTDGVGSKLELCKK